MNQESMTDSATEHVLRPDHRLFWNTWLVGVMLMLPIFLALYWLTIPQGTWYEILIGNLVVALVAAFGADRITKTQVHITPEGIREIGYASRATFTPVNELESILVLKLSDSQTMRPIQQIFMLDHAGHTRLRLRGQFWTPSAMRTVVTAYDLPVKVVDEPITLDEARRTYGQYLYWFERHWVTAIALVALVMTIATVPLLLALMRVI